MSDDDFLPVSSGRLLVDFNHQVTNDDVVLLIKPLLTTDQLRDDLLLKTLPQVFLDANLEFQSFLKF